MPVLALGLGAAYSEMSTHIYLILHA